MDENKDKIKDLLKKFESFIENIHDNYASIQNLERQKKIADKGLDKAINEQIEEINKILMNNQKKADDVLSKVIEITETFNTSAKNSCKKLQSDFEIDKNNPNLIIIQADINQIKKAI